MSAAKSGTGQPACETAPGRAALTRATADLQKQLDVATQALEEARKRADEESRRDPVLSLMLMVGSSFRDLLADRRPCPTCPEMVVVPNGSFTMGSPEREPERESLATGSEGQLKVAIARPFAVGKFLITRGEFASFVDDTKYKIDGGCSFHDGKEWRMEAGRSWQSPGFEQDDQHPVVCVNWDDAKAYAAWLARKTGRPYRLLSETETEYVTRAGSVTPFWWGTTITSSQTNYAGKEVYAGGGSQGEFRGRTVPVDSFVPNPWGIHDAHGNAWKWTEDCWNDRNQGNPADGSARTVGDCNKRVIRGGSWTSHPRALRAAYRSWAPRGFRDNTDGFRIGRSL